MSLTSSAHAFIKLLNPRDPLNLPRTVEPEQQQRLLLVSAALLRLAANKRPSLSQAQHAEQCSSVVRSVLPTVVAANDFWTKSRVQLPAATASSVTATAGPNQNELQALWVQQIVPDINKTIGSLLQATRPALDSAGPTASSTGSSQSLPGLTTPLPVKVLQQAKEAAMQLTQLLSQLLHYAATGGELLKRDHGSAIDDLSAQQLPPKLAANRGVTAQIISSCECFIRAATSDVLSGGTAQRGHTYAATLGCAPAVCCVIHHICSLCAGRHTIAGVPALCLHWSKLLALAAQSSGRCTACCAAW